MQLQGDVGIQPDRAVQSCKQRHCPSEGHAYCKMLRTSLCTAVWRIHAEVLLQVRKPSSAIRITGLTYLLCLGEDLDRLFRQGQGVSTHRSGLVPLECEWGTHWTYNLQPSPGCSQTLILPLSLPWMCRCSLQPWGVWTGWCQWELVCASQIRCLIIQILSKQLEHIHHLERKIGKRLSSFILCIRWHQMSATLAFVFIWLL